MGRNKLKDGGEEEEGGREELQIKRGENEERISNMELKKKKKRR